MACLTHNDNCSALFPGVSPSSPGSQTAWNCRRPSPPTPCARRPCCAPEEGEAGFYISFPFFFCMQAEAQASAPNLLEERRPRELCRGIKGPGARGRATACSSPGTVSLQQSLGAGVGVASWTRRGTGGAIRGGGSSPQVLSLDTARRKLAGAAWEGHWERALESPSQGCFPGGWMVSLQMNGEGAHVHLGGASLPLGPGNLK